MISSHHSTSYKQTTEQVGTISEHSHVDVVIPAEGGWGWVIVFAAFITHILVHGTINIIGIFFPDFVRYFDSNKGTTAMIGSLMGGISYGIGPVCAVLINRYGCRKIAFAGSVTAFFGMLISIFSPNIILMLAFLGVVTGSGLGMMLLPSVILVNAYFTRKRALAIGIAVSGSGFGTLVLAPFIHYLKEYHLNWKNCILLLSALILNGCACAATFRPLQTKEECPLVQEEFQLCESEHKKRPAPAPITEKILSTQSEENLRNKPEIKLRTRSLSENDVRITCGSAYEDYDIDETTSSTVDAKSSLVTPKGRNEIRSRRFLGKTQLESLVMPTGSLLASSVAPTRKMSRACPSTQTSKSVSVSGLLYRKDIFFTGSLTHISERRSFPDVEEVSVISMPLFREKKEVRGLARIFWCSAETQLAFNQMFGVALFKNKAFCLIILCRCLCSVGLMVPYLYTINKAIELDIQNSSWILSIIGVSSSLGRCSMGYISDYKYFNSLWIYIVNMFLCGVSIILSYFCNTFITMTLHASLFGFSSGGYMSVTPILLLDIFGLDNLTNSFSLMLCFQGLAIIAGTPLTGVLYDVSGSYDVGFISSGIVVIFASLLMCFIPYVPNPVPEG